MRLRDILLAFGILALAGCSATVPFVQINIGKVNDVSNALLGGNKGSRSDAVTKNEIGDGNSIEQPAPPAEVMPELDPREENVLGAFENLNRAFSKDKEKDK